MSAIEKVREMFAGVEADIKTAHANTMREKALAFIQGYLTDVREMYAEYNSSEKDVDAVAYKGIGAVWAYEEIGVITWEEALYWQERINAASYGNDAEVSE